LSLQGPNAEHSTEYIGTPTWVLSRALDRLQLDPRDFVFVDLGSGKGRVILRAATRPFRRSKAWNSPSRCIASPCGISTMPAPRRGAPGAGRRP
jgi:hypothetical protein